MMKDAGGGEGERGQGGGGECSGVNWWYTFFSYKNHVFSAQAGCP